MYSSVRPYFMFLLGSAVALCLAIWAAEHTTFMWSLCSVVILVAGLPHGAYDWVIMRAQYERRRLGAMVSLYIALVGLVIALWLIAPQALLAAFLAYSAYHFGDSDLPNTSWGHKASWGGAIVGLPALVAAADVQLLFAVLTEDSVAQVLISLLGAVGFIAAVIHVWMAPSRWVPALLLGVYGSVCGVAGALMGFTCYFALLHGPTHLTRWRNVLDQQGFGVTTLLSCLVIAAIAGAVWINTANSGSAVEAINQTTLRYTFIALAALTVPHMVLLSMANHHDH